MYKSMNVLLSDATGTSLCCTCYLFAQGDITLVHFEHLCSYTVSS